MGVDLPGHSGLRELYPFEVELLKTLLEVHFSVLHISLTLEDAQSRLAHILMFQSPAIV